MRGELNTYSARKISEEIGRIFSCIHARIIIQAHKILIFENT